MLSEDTDLHRWTRPWEDAAAQQRVVLLLVRHGQTEWNATHRFVGKTDVPLDDVGRAQARLAAARLPGPLAGVYSSPLSRALHTAKAVHPDPTLVPGLAELDQGDLEGLDGPTALRRYPDFFKHWSEDPATATVPGGERLTDLVQRVLPSLAHIASQHRAGEVVGVYTHQMVISTATCTAHGHPLSRWREHRVGNAHGTAVAWSPEGLQVVVQRVPYGDDTEDGGARHA